MGKKAKKQKVVTKKKPVLAKRFKCPFCANEQAVECKMDRPKGIGSLSCRLCGASYQMPIHHLNEPIDVFSEWLDDCEAADRQNRGLPPTRGEASSNARESSGNVTRDYGEDEEDDDDFIEQPSGLHNSSSDPPRRSGENEHLKRKRDSSKQEGEKTKSATTYASLGLDSSDDSDE